MKKVLILGAGMVAKPIVEYLMREGYRIVIASPMKGRADEMIGGNPLGASVDWSMDDPETLDLLISGNDITVSLLPYKYHSQVARLCLAHKRPLVTTSYVQKEMQGLDEAAKNAGIIFLNEMGLDPGIDHMSAMKIIDLIHRNGGKVEQFYSICGALPAPEAADNPMKYKFSWSPRGVILAGLNSALYLHNGKRKLVDSRNLFRSTFTLEFKGIGEFEVYANRDSVNYLETYGITEASTIFRGTFRYKGWCETIDAFKSLGMLDDTLKDYSGMTYSDFLAERSGATITDIRKSVAAKLDLPSGSVAIQSLDFLGFFSDEKLNYYETTPLEITSDRMIRKMMLGETERDMIIMQHIFLASWPDGRKEVIKSSLTDFGILGGNTAISRTVALPAAIGVKLILEGKISSTGVQIPVLPEIYNPVLEELKFLGIEMKEEYWQPESEITNLKI
ncbi:MAG TPA: saccharopine dehydrogenase C-terminal domain-containing protein [Bacteroidales bacterium]|nr:saccharopine dehydrogenase C-terminal domain-containing protein [Bacteroidales bacterium]